MVKQILITPSFKTNTFYLIIIFFFSSIYYTVSSNSLLTQDIVWLMHVAKLSLNKGVYIKDYFETNPPLCFYIYLPPVFLTLFFKMDLKISFIIYNLLISALSLGLIGKCLTHFNLEKKQSIFIFFYIALWFFVIPLVDIGQRDVFSSILVTPHILFSFIATQKRNRFYPYQQWVMIIMAMIGYMIKPQFLLLWFCLFSTHLFISKSFTKSLKASNGMSLFISGLLYLLVVYLFNKDYYTLALPIIFETYYPSMQPNRILLLLNDPYFIFKSFFICLITLVFSLQIKTDNKRFYLALFVIAIGYTLIYLVQGLGFTYHSVPALFGICLLIMSISLCEFKKNEFFIGTFCFGIFLTLFISVKSANIAASVSDVVNAKKELLLGLPNNATVSMLTCESNGINTLPLNAIFSASFPSLLIPCTAYSNDKKIPFKHLKKRLIADFISRDADFIMMPRGGESKVNNLEKEIFDEIYINNTQINLLANYKVYKAKGCYQVLVNKKIKLN